MTRNHNRDGIVVVGLSDSAVSVRASHGLCDLRITARLAVGNAQEFLPASLLKVSASKIEGDGELATLAREVLFHLSATRFRRLHRFVPRDWPSSNPLGHFAIKGENHERRI